MLIDQADQLWIGGVAGGLWVCRDPYAPTPVWEEVTGGQWTAPNPVTGVPQGIPNIAISALAEGPPDLMNFPVSPSTMYAGTGEGWFAFDGIVGAGIWRSTDGGATWSHLQATEVTQTDRRFDHIQKIAVTNSGAILASTREAGLFRSTNFGINWSPVLDMNPGSTTVLGMGSLSNRAADIEIAQNGDIFVSMGFGPVPGGGAGAAFESDGIYKSTADGQFGTWQPLFSPGSGLPDPINLDFGRIEIAVAPSDANRVYALIEEEPPASSGATPTGFPGACYRVLRSDDGG
ncbi:MAG: WD40/YVTN/BNR-like repeat-containing protein, partial [Bacteroidia bacterium]